MKIYIAGKVTGMHIAECTMLFGAAQKKIEAGGHEAINPLQVVNDWHCPWPLAMRKCLAAMLECDEVYVLQNWKQSTGAQLEVQIARALTLPVTFEPNLITQHS